ncbi:DUF2202 domain-containing protein [Thermococcus aciditolerans]|uniref:DUF2202 domain-containing protein n=1 Tax=Thermococcus aciditolerans TaxID=2598455 RepID=A0A5C0SKW3_9EURY|nr:DUF2202 domain-containing protein [Thermococcus aciditolerans]QEK14396.1 DUF2202 domain-containing protein [Thermococcus aciditolerans]
MRKKIWGIALLMLAALGFTLGSVAAWHGTPGENPYAGRTTAPMLNGTMETYYSDLSQEEIDGLLYMVEEEKLARDVYLTLYEQWDLPVFSNIARSEQMHMDAVLSLIEKYNLTAPETLDEVGVFQNDDLQALYDQLVEMGSVSQEDALKVGALIEETDIKDLEDWIAQTDNEDIKQVYENLMAGSENHLRAFAGQLEVMGVDYTAQVLPGEQVDEILASAPDHDSGMKGAAVGMMGARHGDAGTQGGIIDGIANTFRHAWGWMRGFAHRVGMPL